MDPKFTIIRFSTPLKIPVALSCHSDYLKSVEISFVDLIRFLPLNLTFSRLTSSPEDSLFEFTFRNEIISNTNPGIPLGPKS